MENDQVTLRKIYDDLQNLKTILKQKNILDQIPQSSILADETLLSEDWLSPEDEEAWKDL